MNCKLVDLQSLLYRLITSPVGVEEAARHEPMLQGCGLEGAIVGEQRLSAAERLGIYASAYFHRLHDILKEEFDCTYTVLGEVNFHNLITGYLTEYPPTKPSVLDAGARLPHYLRSVNSLAGISMSQWPFIADLARLERACLEVFHGVDAEVLDENWLRQLTPESWPSLRIRLQPAAQILDVDWPVDGLMNTIKEARQWQSPVTASAAILVWRQKSQVRYRSLAPGERDVLTTAASGSDFASICESLSHNLESLASITDLAASINRMLSDWIRDGVLTSA
ncbi:MAG: putative DNA-binding domain-containing protein [Deltaproteobacteria bacterium]|nr:putative DNA-binding domain-containing protein [Deltaproteobacteria bacterium]